MEKQYKNHRYTAQQSHKKEKTFIKLKNNKSLQHRNVYNYMSLPGAENIQETMISDPTPGIPAWGLY
jgi:hypothetical protein